MKGGSVKKSERFKMMVIVAVIIIILNGVAVLFFPLYTSRSFRLVGSTVLGGYFIWLFPKQCTTVIPIIIAFWLRDIAAIFYENGPKAWGYFVFGGLAYLALFFGHLKSVLGVKIVVPSIVLSFLVILACFGILYNIEAVMDVARYNKSLIYYFYFFGISIVFSILLAIYYYYRLGGNKALSFSYAVFLLTISDIAAYLGIYLENYSFFLATRGFYFGGLIMLMNFAIVRKDIHEEEIKG